MTRNQRTIHEVAPEGMVEVRRSARRRRTVSAFREEGRLVIAIPASFTRRQEREWIAKMVERVRRSEERRQVSSEDLFTRANELAGEYLPAGVRPSSVRWVTNQNARWGSCTPMNGSIRISHRLKKMPAWVLDYVLVHELAHLVERGHGEDFWRIVNEYPRTERARGFLDGVSYFEQSPTPDSRTEPQPLEAPDLLEPPEPIEAPEAQRPSPQG